MTWTSIREPDRTCPACRAPLPDDGSVCPFCKTAARPRARETRPPRLDFILIGVLAVVVAFSLLRRPEPAKPVAGAPAPEPPPPAASFEDERRSLRAQIAALEGERDDLKRRVESAEATAAARQADLELELEALRAALEEKVRSVLQPEPAPVEKKPEPAPPPPEPPKPAPEPPKPAPEPPKVVETPVRRPPPVTLGAELDEKVRQCLEKLRGDLAGRKAATDTLLDLRRREPKVRTLLRWVLEDEADPRVQARIRYVLEAVELGRGWDLTLPAGRPPSNDAVATASLLVLPLGGAGLTAYHAHSGTLAWTQNPAVSQVFSPVLAGDHLVSIFSGGGTGWSLQRTRLSDGRTDLLPCKIGRAQFLLHGDGTLVALAPAPTKVECWDVRTGQKRWDGAVAASTAPFALSDGRLFILDPQRRLVCLSTTGFKEAWSSDANGLRIVGSAGAAVLVADARGALTAYEAAGGKPLWKVEDTFRSGILSMASADGCVLLRTYTAWLGLELETGKTLWTAPVAPATTRAAPAPVAGFFARPDGGDVAVIEPRSGREILRRSFGAQPVITALAAQGTRLFVVLQDSISAFDVR